MAFDSPHVFYPCYFHSLSSSSYPWLVALWCLSAINASFRPLPRVHSLFGTGYFTALDLFTSSSRSFFFHQKSRARSFSLCMDPHFIILSCVSLLSFDTLWRSLHPCCFQRSLPILFLTCAHPRSCVAVWVIQVIMVNKCAISTETSLWSGTSSVSACLHAAVLIGGGIFLSAWLRVRAEFATFLHRC